MIQVKKIIAKRFLNDNQAKLLEAKFLDNNSYDTLITEDCDGYTANGELLFKFRKGVVPIETLNLGYNSFKGAIKVNHGRGNSAGGYFNELKKDGTYAKFDISPDVESGNVGYMDARAGGGTTAVCRKTAFARDYFETFKQGVPFVEKISNLYEQLCPEHYKLQKAISVATNTNYRIGGSVYTTVTVNKNFQTAVHKDFGDYNKGFGNLCVYRQGYYDGCYFVLPEYRIAIDLHNTDLLFADVHKWHGNTPFENCSPDYLRVSFVMYYRENMVLCKQPKEELLRIKMNQTGYLTL